MRGIDTPVRKMRREIFKEIAQLAYHSDNLNDDGKETISGNHHRSERSGCI